MEGPVRCIMCGGVMKYYGSVDRYLHANGLPCPNLQTVRICFLTVDHRTRPRCVTCDGPTYLSVYDISPLNGFGREPESN